MWYVRFQRICVSIVEKFNDKQQILANIDPATHTHRKNVNKLLLVGIQHSIERIFKAFFRFE